MDRYRAYFGKNFLFVIEKSCDSNIIVYEAYREKDKLVEPYVDCFWTDKKKLTHVEQMTDYTKQRFFAVKVRPTDRKSKYDMVVVSIPSRLIKIHLKKSGKCVAKTIIDGKEATLLSIFLNVTVNSLGIPNNISSIKVSGKHKLQMVNETIEVTDEMRSQFDMSLF
jgi:hypothetical protein